MAINSINWRSIGFIVVGVAVGLIAAAVFPWVGSLDGASVASHGSPNGDAKSRSTSDLRIAQLENEIRALRESAATFEKASEEMPFQPPNDLRAAREKREQDLIAFVSQRDVDRLLAAGFSKERIDFLTRRTEELKGKQARAEYERKKMGLALDLNSRKYMYTPDIDLRLEIGDDEYTRYLQALDRPIGIDVLKVPAGSLAENAGLKNGDEILSYAGKRVYNFYQLNELIEQGRLGGSTAIEVRRGGRNMSFVMANGPSGVEPKSYIQRAIEHRPSMLSPDMASKCSSAGRPAYCDELDRADRMSR